MKRVTQAYIRRGQLAELELDGGERVTVDRRTWEESPYRVGSSLSEHELEQLLDQSRRNRTKEKALYLLSQRDYSRQGLTEKLMREKGRYQADREAAARETADRMEELGLINDEAYARRLAGDCQRRLFPRRRTLQELQAKGIDRETARVAVEELEIPDGQLALELLRKRYYNRLHTPEDRRKTTAALVRYGFGYEDIRRAFRAIDLEMQDDE
jgi:regulatory protein